MNLFRTKSIESLVAEGADTGKGLKRELTAVDLVALGIGALAAGGQAVRLQDAAADAARLIARADDESRARAVADVAGASSFTVSRQGDLVCVAVASPVAVALAPQVQPSLRPRRPTTRVAEVDLSGLRRMMTG